MYFFVILMALPFAVYVLQAKSFVVCDFAIHSFILMRAKSFVFVCNFTVYSLYSCVLGVFFLFVIFFVRSLLYFLRFLTLQSI